MAITKPMAGLKLREIAERINLHLRRMELDLAINVVDPVTGYGFLYRSGCRPSGNRVIVWYVATDGPVWLARKDAEAYLEWLDAGNNGKHSDAGIETQKRGPVLRRRV